MHYIYLVAAIVCEVIGTTALKSARGFTVVAPSVIVVASYAAAFYLLSLALEAIPTAVAYAIWCAGGIVLISIAAMAVHRERPDGPAILGMALIVAGVVVLNLFSKMTAH
jgi:small multidrug resistance pump